MIRVLDKHVADKIAAGEVIDRPVSIVKELLENALDAGAHVVTIELRNGGKSYLRITDNGCGIPEEDVELAFRRHATSKITAAEDLDAVHTLGFRGEALASICAVARVEMITKPAEAHMGRHLLVEDSRVLKNEPTGCPDGTTVTVSDLFFNVPARRKFLGSDGAEARRITDLVSRIACSYPDVRFRLISGGKEIFQTAGRGNILDNILRIYGKDMGRDLVAVDAEQDDLKLRGFVSGPGLSSSSRNRQFFCINGRVVSSKAMQQGLEKAYRERLFPGRFPVAFLYLIVPPQSLDVNVHPTKQEVRFDDPFQVEDFIADAINRSLQAKEAIPGLHTKDAPAQGMDAVASGAGDQGKQVDLQQMLQSMRKERPISEKAVHPAGEKLAGAEEITKQAGSAHFALPSQETDAPPAQIRERAADYQISQEAGGLRSMPEDSPDDPAMTPAPTAPLSRGEDSLDIAGLTIIGCVFDTYIITTDGTCMYLIDQHAAHERVFYEQLLAQYHRGEKYRQAMLLPLQLSVSADVEQAEMLWIDQVRQMGYDIENFGNRTYLVREMPAFMDAATGERFLRQLMIEIADAPDITGFAKLERIILRSCKSAVKGGDHLHPEEMTSLLSQLAQCQRPWSCPHGRPTIVRMTKYELEKLFKRV